MRYGATLIPGDGIGPEVTEAAVRVIDAVCPGIHWERMDAGMTAYEAYGTPLPEKLLESVKRHRIALKGPLTTPVGKGFASVNVGIRKALDLYVSLRPVNTLPAVKTHHDGVDLVIFRENTEGLYAGIEHEPVPGVVESLRIATAAAWSRFVKHAYEWARYNGRRKVHLVHKASIMKLTDGLFLDIAREIAAEYPFIATHEILTDQLFMDLVLDPTQFDVLITDNLFGDLVSDLGAGLVGGLGVVPGANIGDRYAVFEAVHGSAPDIAGRGIANPIAIIRSGAMMLDYIGERRAAARVERAVRVVLEKGTHLTGDLGGKADTRGITDAIIAEL
ncbi:MAG: isocitrate/isopropylmalate dehydrogenase family protein [Myxococcales bacterium]|nr:isocitrate/isopropylmalate dehydrogenase family protein [Myxococcales bacterium]MCB9730998.1 isocitrate/isopropylmalate dehydrogenase family protein [Deltaproteobacteria bacterium]